MGLRLACLVLSGLLAGAAPAMAEANCQGQSIPAATVPLICSKTFYVRGKCTRQDELALWGADEGHRLQPPWEESAISILGAAIVWLHPVHGFQYAFIGNSYTPDVMLWAKGGEAGATAGFWAPYAFRFPASGSPGQPHIDLHVACEKDDFQGFVTILYTVP